MNTLNRKNISVALLITLGAIFSVNANAAETSNLENSLSEMIVAQGQQVMVDLKAELQQSITQEINSFSIDFSFNESISDSLAWLNDEQATSVAEHSNQENSKHSN
ncbi:hypothetical protein NBRC116592_17320 [Colwellia sp. KU-HH00111]|uniref:hypothetical protein n=1 Tax=Colwellia sp. KU-HH00111 TaxID=3127652 RepID=UPI0031048878